MGETFMKSTLSQSFLTAKIILSADTKKNMLESATKFISAMPGHSILPEHLNTIILSYNTMHSASTRAYCLSLLQVPVTEPISVSNDIEFLKIHNKPKEIILPIFNKTTKNYFSLIYSIENSTFIIVDARLPILTNQDEYNQQKKKYIPYCSSFSQLLTALKLITPSQVTIKIWTTFYSAIKIPEVDDGCFCLVLLFSL